MTDEKIIIPESLMKSIIEKYRGGVTIMDLSNEYNIPYDLLRFRLGDYKINVADFASENCGKIMKAESKLITGSFPNYKLNLEIDGKGNYNKFKSLLFYYANADLNSNYVHFSKLLLV